MTTHDVLAFAVAGEAVRRIRHADPIWATIFSPATFASSARAWPVPDFVLTDAANGITAAGEFKPPDQTKREYLTGLGQAIAYTEQFTHGILVVPTVADDNYPIGEHIQRILDQEVLGQVPVALLQYDPAAISPQNAAFDVLRPLGPRQGAGPAVAAGRVGSSFWAKWRDISLQETGKYLECLYDAGRVVTPADGRSVGERGFEQLWNLLQTGQLRHLGGGVRRVANSVTQRNNWNKNYRNFIRHIGWADHSGKLTSSGLTALHLAHQYGSESRLFLDHVARTVLIEGKHLVLINKINDFQTRRIADSGPFGEEQAWLNEVEAHLEDAGLLERNVERHLAAVQGEERQFLKAEKTLWKTLEYIVPYGQARRRAFHPGRGFVFNWTRITSLLQ